MSLLEIKQLSKHFGGLVAVNQMNFDVSQGEIVGLIGPNGAGKTTVFNLISGIFPATAGSILLNGQELNRMPAHKRCRAGIGRTFQVVHAAFDFL